MNEQKRLRRLIELFEALFERDQLKLAKLLADKQKVLNKQRDAFEFLACDVPFKYGIADEVVKGASRAARDIGRLEKEVQEASAAAALRKAQLDRMKRKYQKATQAAYSKPSPD